MAVISSRASVLIVSVQPPAVTFVWQKVAEGSVATVTVPVGVPEAAVTVKLTVTSIGGEPPGSGDVPVIVVFEAA
jgi:hypothetical protein